MTSHIVRFFPGWKATHHLPLRDPNGPQVPLMLEQRKEQHVAFIEMRGALRDKENLVALTDELNVVCRSINLDPEIHVVVLKGIEIQDPESSPPIAIRGVRPGENSLSLSDSLGRLERPVFAEMNGNIVGQSLELALACDIRVAGKTSHFGLPHVLHGLMPSDGGTQRLSRLIGKAKAIEMILTGEVIDAQEAYRIGLVNKVTGPDEVSKVVSDMAHEMASKGPIALRYAKEAINKGLDLTLEQGLRLEADLYFLLHTTEDRSEGIRAFQEKRKPRFNGK